MKKKENNEEENIRIMKKKGKCWGRKDNSDEEERE